MSNNPPKTLRNVFVPPPAEKCTRCGNRVYQVEKVGPVNEVIFHKQCFKCCQCGQRLSLKTYFTNQKDLKDPEVYCSKHCPKVCRVVHYCRSNIVSDMHTGTQPAIDAFLVKQTQPILFGANPPLPFHNFPSPPLSLIHI